MDLHPCASVSIRGSMIQLLLDTVASRRPLARRTCMVEAPEPPMDTDAHGLRSIIQVLLDTVASRRPLARRTWMVEAGGAAALSLTMGPGGVVTMGEPRSREGGGVGWGGLA